MATGGAKAKNPLRPEVMAVIRFSFDGYNEPDSRGEAKKPKAKKNPAKKTAAKKTARAKTKPRR
jgi:hypothetical protein